LIYQKEVHFFIILRTALPCPALGRRGMRTTRKACEEKEALTSVLRPTLLYL
jgi:hypothetical protein